MLLIVLYCIYRGKALATLLYTALPRPRSVNEDIIKRYRCYIGHAYTEKDLVVKQAETASATMWVALRMMEERKHLLKKMQIDSEKKRHKTLSSSHVARHGEMERHIDNLKKILFELQNR